MYELSINGNIVTLNKDKKLIDLLRNDLNLISVKDGCSEGACGACTVLVDGKAIRACVQKVSRFVGKNVLTVEGLTEREKDVYVHCFANAGAVQCGYCIPGMVLAAKALLDTNLEPSRDEVKKAIRGNICRCTGYKKIEDAILDAARYFRENLSVPNEHEDGALSTHFKRVDAKDKVLGTGLYAGDLVLPNMIYAKALRTKYPRALIKSIDITKAEQHEDVVRILTSKDVPCNKHGHLIQDWDVLVPVGGITRYIGDALVLVATKHKESLNEVLDLIEVEYEELPCLDSPTEALRPLAPLVHYENFEEGMTNKDAKDIVITKYSLQKLSDGTYLDFESPNILKKEVLVRGNVKEALENSKYVVTKRYRSPFVEHAFMEPECAVAAPDGDGIILYTGSQSVYDEQKEVSNVLQIDRSKVHVHSMLVGGGFGGKEDQSVQHHAALMAWHTKLPVKVQFSRQESLNIHTKRHPMEMEFTTGCDENGHLTALKAEIISDTGAYASLGGPVLQRACTHAGGPYNFQNIDIVGIAVYTNNVVSGAYRGFGVTQSCYAMENNINLLAEMVGISPWEMRYRNAIRPGQVLPNGQIADQSAALVECLEAVKEVYEAHPYAGIACAFKNSGIGVGLPDIGRCIISIENGMVHIRTSAACMGQGIATMCTQVVCETTGISPEFLIHEAPDTSRTPNSGTSTASRQTVITGEATRIAASHFFERFTEEIRKVLNGEMEITKDYISKYSKKEDIINTLKNLNGEEFYGEFNAVTDPMGSPKDNPVSHVSYSYGAVVAVLDDDGSGKLSKVVAAYDVGTVVNPQSAEGQGEGGVVMGLSNTLTEDFKIEKGIPKVKFGTLGLMRATDVPELEIKLVHGSKKLPLTYGAKGIGELSLIPVGPACSHAYYRLDHKLRTEMPLLDTYYKK